MIKLKLLSDLYFVIFWFNICSIVFSERFLSCIEGGRYGFVILIMIDVLVCNKKLWGCSR